MNLVAEHPSTNVALWREYRQAFAEFARKARTVQSLKEAARPLRASIDDALIELERARLHHNNRRDTLAAALLPNSNLASPAPRDHADTSASSPSYFGTSKIAATAVPTTTGTAPKKSSAPPWPKRHGNSPPPDEVGRATRLAMRPSGLRPRRGARE